MNNENHEALTEKLQKERREKNRLLREIKKRDSLIATYQQNAIFQEKLYDMVKKQKDKQDIFLSLMLSKSTDIIVLMDTNRRFILGTKNKLRKIGMNADALGEKDFMESLRAVLSLESYDKLFAALQTVLTTGEALEYSSNAVFKDGQEYYYTIAVIPFQNEDGDVIGVMLQIHDITALQKAIDDAESANKTKSRFLAVISHEIRTPLTVIATGIDFADEQVAIGGDNNEIRNALDIVRNENQRLGRMVGSMAHLSAMGDSNEYRKRVDFSAFLRNSAEIFRLTIEKQKNTLQVELAAGLPDVYVEADRFTQIITNLFSNATRHTQDGQITLSAQFDETYITVNITDTGSGISPELLPRVFERGATGGYGAGYGLYICKTIVEAHGGTINIESELNKGTTVIFTVPVYGGQEAGYAD